MNIGNTMVALNTRRSALDTKCEQILLSARKRVQIARKIAVLQAEYFLLLSYEESKDEDEPVFIVPSNISPAELQIFQDGAMNIVRNTTLSRNRQFAAKGYYESLAELLDTMAPTTANESDTEDAMLEQLRRNIAEMK